MACAISSRPLPFWNGLRLGPATIPRNCRGTLSPGLPGLPRLKTTGSVGVELSSKAIARRRAGMGGVEFVPLALERAQLLLAGSVGETVQFAAVQRQDRRAGTVENL